MLSEIYNTDLNERQKEAVFHQNGPLLVLAGAGTGKTRVLTYRISHLIGNNSAKPNEILAVTFTNKAARQMQERIENLCPNSYGLTVGTFHSIAARFLRQYADLVGLTGTFTIIDQDDQIKLIKNILEELHLTSNARSDAKIIHAIISRWKDLAISNQDINSGDIKTDEEKIAYKTYPIYQERLVSANLCDFGDLLLYNTIIFFQHPNILEALQTRYKYILIDEYQDTNTVQYLWARMLADKYKNICCVGDDDQSIYSWRGAEIANILRFGKDFPGAKIVALEQNYRSTSHILKVAADIIKYNKQRHSKTLWTNFDQGEKVKIISCYNDKEEAQLVASIIKQESSRDNKKFNNFAVLVRAGFQTRSFEEVFINNSLPYRIVGGFKFYERAEIKDIMAYIRLILNENDNIAFERVINTPRRSIGPSTTSQIKTFANEHGVSYLAALQRLVDNGAFKNKLEQTSKAFLTLITEMRSEFLCKANHADIVKQLILSSGYREMLQIEKTDESRSKLDNLNELVSAIGEYSNIQEFIEHISLIMDNETDSDVLGINLMTIHASKGLEFDSVFIPGLEEGIFPHQKTLNETGMGRLEEERRIAYVAVTRAKKHLYLLYSEKRRLYNEIIFPTPSRFLADISPDSTQNLRSTAYVKNISSPNFKSITHTNLKPITITQEKFRPGSRVSHKSFGRGIILKKNADNLEIYFDNQGIKTIKESFLTEC